MTMDLSSIADIEIDNNQFDIQTETLITNYDCEHFADSSSSSFLFEELHTPQPFPLVSHHFLTDSSFFSSSSCSSSPSVTDTYCVSGNQTDVPPLSPLQDHQSAPASTTIDHHVQSIVSHDHDYVEQSVCIFLAR
jgi:hypothetical protein